jgi:rhodanese-related sulfurtransferase
LVERLALIKEVGNLLVLDVRTLDEYSQGHIKGSLHIPVQELEKRHNEIPSGRPVLLVCRTGRRVVTAYGILEKSRPELLATGLWYLSATPEYDADGGYTFKTNTAPSSPSE